MRRLRRPEPHLARAGDVVRGQQRYWPDGRVNAVYPNGDGARFYGTFTARYPEWLWRYYASTGDRATATPSTSR